ncbi:hypothetical protein [Pedobacter sp. N23S346]|uniref:hypothetical protein n=1 Tax=Pedobacter sp. N23S346 TaxID=3402750 RepID=UPI003AD4E914
METKKLSYNHDGISDCSFTTSALVLPKVIGLDRSSVIRYSTLSINQLAYNLLSYHYYSAAKAIKRKTHLHIDLFNIALLPTLPLFHFVRRKKKVLAYHLALHCTCCNELSH